MRTRKRHVAVLARLVVEWMHRRYLSEFELRCVHRNSKSNSKWSYSPDYEMGPELGNTETASRFSLARPPDGQQPAPFLVGTVYGWISLAYSLRWDREFESISRSFRRIRKW